MKKIIEKKINKKIKSLSNKREVYEYGFKKGFGRGLGMCIHFLRTRGTGNLEINFYYKLEEEMKNHVLWRMKKNG